MKRTITLLFAFFFFVYARAQNTGDYRSVKSGNWGDISTWETYSGGNWVAATSVVSTRNYTVREGHTVTIATSTSCNALTVEQQAVLRSVRDAGETTVYLRMGHAGNASVTILNNGRIGGTEEGIGGALILETSGVALGFKLTGTGICRVARLRALQGNTKNVTIEIDQDVTVTDATAPFTAYTNSSASVAVENFTMTINPQKTVKIANPSGFFHVGANTVTNQAGSYTYNIDGTLDLSESTVTSYIIPFANNAASNVTVNVNGLLKLGTGLDLVNAAPSTSNNGSVSINLNNNGIIDATRTTLMATGSNYFKVAGNGTLIRKVDNQDITFPLGLQSAVSPNFVTISNTGVPSNFSVRISDNFDVPTSSTQIVNKKWEISTDDAGTIANLKLNWKAADHGNGFNPTQSVSLIKLDGATWSSVGNATVTGPDLSGVLQAEISGMTSFGTFALQNSATLPLNFISFDAKLKGTQFSKEVFLSWTTENEVNTESFIIERSLDGVNFKSIGRALSKNTRGTNNYSFNDYAPLLSTSYYRLKQLDRDGKFDYSIIRSINNNSELKLSLYPNPSNETVNLVHPMADTNSVIDIFDSTGKLILSSTAAMGTSNTNINISHIAANVYFLQFKKGGNKSILKFIKN